MNPLAQALRFVGHINRPDIDSIVALTADDHQFIDSGGEVHQGRARMREGWSTYLGMLPDYHIDVHEWFVDGPVVVLLGTAGGTYSRAGELYPEDAWSTPTAWRAVVEHHRIAEWRVYADNEPLRARMADDPDRARP
jgi:ketosteroid isomerase-like protein